MKLEVQYVGALDTSEIIKLLFSKESEESIDSLCEKVSPVLYEFNVQF